MERETLTARELEVLDCYGRGMNRPEIAKALFISRSTVSVHRAMLLAKLGLRDTVALALFAAQTFDSTSKTQTAA